MEKFGKPLTIYLEAVLRTDFRTEVKFDNQIDRGDS